MQRLWKYVRDQKGGHDIDHIRRVFSHAQKLAAYEPSADNTILQAAVILHDICRGEEDADPTGRSDHALMGAERAEGILAAEGFPSEQITKICACIATHRYSSHGNPPESLEAKILFDADKLDGLGAVGIARLFMLAGQYGERLYAKPPEGFGCGARVFRISDLSEYSANLEFLGKMRFVPERLFLPQSKKEARRLLAPMTAFFALLDEEIAALDAGMPPEYQENRAPPDTTCVPVQTTLTGDNFPPQRTDNGSAAPKSIPKQRDTPPKTTQDPWDTPARCNDNPSAKDQVTLYTDGACKRNPGPGGWAYILSRGDVKKEMSGGKGHTTNNEMELTAVVMGLEALTRPCVVDLYSDSKYIIDALVKGWAKRWRANGWRLASKQPAKNQGLWEKLLLLSETHTLRSHWVKGHADNPQNNRCDELATAQAAMFDS